MRRTVVNLLLLLSFTSSAQADDTKLTLHYNWSYGTYPHPVDLVLDQEHATACSNFYNGKGIKHMDDNDYYRFILIDPCADITRTLALALKEDAIKYNYNPLQAIGNALNFVRSITYKNDIEVQKVDHYVQYPAETILLGSGDCEDLALLYGAILSHWCVESLLIEIPGAGKNPGHLAAAVNTATFTTTCRENSFYYDIDGQRYYYCEATGPKLRDSNNPVQVLDIGTRLELDGLPAAQYDSATIYRVPLSCDEALTPPSPPQAAPKAVAATAALKPKTDAEKYFVGSVSAKMLCVSSDEAAAAQECKAPQEIYVRQKTKLTKLDVMSFSDCERCR